MDLDGADENKTIFLVFRFYTVRVAPQSPDY